MMRKILAASTALLWALTCFSMVNGYPHRGDILLARNPRGAVSLVNPTLPACSLGPVVSGTLSLSVSSPRTSGISPLTLFVDATGTTDSAITRGTSVFQDVQFTHNYGDAGSISGSGAVWQNGSGTGFNSRNTSTGAAGAHMYYVAPGSGDQTFTETVTANDGTNIAGCTISVTVLDPFGVNGYTKVTCVGNTLPVKGAGGCPNSIAASGGVVNVLAATTFAAGAAVVSNNSATLFHCGDTFTAPGDTGISSVAHGAIGAYGGCENTKTNRPIFSFTGTPGAGDIMLPAFGSSTMGDFRLMDFDCQSPVLNAGGGCFTFASNSNNIPYQVTMYNLNSARMPTNYYWSHGAQFALIDVVALNQQAAIGTFINVDGNGTGTWTGSPFNNIMYQTVQGSFIAGTGDTFQSAGDESLRISACQVCLFSNNTFKDANNQGAVFKLFESNNDGTGGSKLNYAGIPVQFVNVEDNLMFGNSGAYLSEVAPQNTCFDEHILDVVVERNVFQEANDNLASFILISGQRVTFRDNVMYAPSGFVHPSFFHVQLGGRVAQTGAPGNGCPSNPTGTVLAPINEEMYNNLAYMLSFHSPQVMIDIDVGGLNGVPAGNSYFANNLYFSPSGSTTSVNSGSGNTLSNNTASASTTTNPNITNGSTTFVLMSDFKPTNSAAYSGGTSVPVLNDGVLSSGNPYGAPWPPTWDLGAVHH